MVRIMDSVLGGEADVELDAELDAELEEELVDTLLAIPRSVEVTTPGLPELGKAVE